MELLICRIWNPQTDCDTQVNNPWSNLLFLNTFYNVHRPLIFLCFFHYKRILLETYKEAYFIQICMKIGLVSLMKNPCLEKFQLYEGNDIVYTWGNAQS